MQAIVKVALYPLHTCLAFMNAHVPFDMFLQFPTATKFRANMAMSLLHIFSQVFFICKVLVTARLIAKNLYIYVLDAKKKHFQLIKELQPY